MAKIFALFVAGFVLLRGLILFTEPLWLALLGVGLVIVLILIWASGWIARRLSGADTVTDVPETGPPTESDTSSETDSDTDSDTDSEPTSEPTSEPEVPPEGMTIAIVGWAGLLILLALVLFLGPEEEPALLEGHLPACDEAA